MRAKLLFICLVWPFALLAQGFSGLGTDADGFALPQPEPQFSFPSDHGAHPDYRIEWWYLTANLEDAQGVPYGLQWTLFRTALAPGEGEGWASPQVWFAHAAITTPKAHVATERFARGGTGQAGVEVAPFRAWIDEWEMAGDDLEGLRLFAQGPDFAYDMTLRAEGPLVFHGDGGYSVKSREGHASYYYSQPFFRISGKLDLPEGPVEVSGQAWMDREWSSQPLSDNQQGWDWFSLTFEDGTRLMGAQVRHRDGPHFTAATRIAPTGETQAYADGDFQAEPLDTARVAGRDIPVRWRVQLADMGLDATVEAVNPDAWMGLSIPYWEGPVRIRGSHAGVGYLEMTGYE